MKYLQNLHTHSVYCDGKDTPEELAQRAIELGFDTLGYSTHSYMFFSPYMSKKSDRTSLYKEEINRLKPLYEDKIRLLCGIEMDMYSIVDLSGFDYLIGSSHYAKIGDKYISYERELELLYKEYFNEDFNKLSRFYYESLCKMHDIVDRKIDIIGHIDLITKNSEKLPFIDTSSKEYKSYAIEAVRKLSCKTDIFEMNTGAIARNVKKTAYPEDFIIKEITRLGKGIIITSDCHDMTFLNCEFDKCIERLIACGVGEVYVYDDGSFKSISLY